MANVAGANQFQREKPYGAAKKLTQLSRSAPMSGAAIPAINTPQRSQAQAVRGRAQPRQQAQAPVAPPPMAPAPYEAQLAQAWAEIASEIDHPLVHEYAARASGQGA